MARSLKSLGREQIAELIKRTHRQLALNRITEIDATFIVEHLRKVDQRIVRMTELDEQGNPEEIGDIAPGQKKNSSQAQHDV